MFVVFFFSSRRRHTRCGRDWSSDVCSSDLTNILDCRRDFCGHRPNIIRRWYLARSSGRIAILCYYRRGSDNHGYIGDTWQYGRGLALFWGFPWYIDMGFVGSWLEYLATGSALNRAVCLAARDNSNQPLYVGFSYREKSGVWGNCRGYSRYGGGDFPHYR